MVIEAKALPAPINLAAFTPPPAAVQPSVAKPSGATPEFTFKDQKVRVVVIEGEPWFAAMDVGVLLFNEAAVRAKGVSQYLYNIAPEERQVMGRGHALTLDLLKGHPKARQLTLITESGLYKLVMRSDKPEAKAFQDWVTREVLPSIRKTGSYSVAPTAADYGFKPVAPRVPVEAGAPRNISPERCESQRYY